MFFYGKRRIPRTPATRGGKKPGGGSSEGAVKKPSPTIRVVIFEAGNSSDTPEKRRAQEAIYRLMFGDEEHVPTKMVWVFPVDPTQPPSASNPLNMSREYELIINNAHHLGRNTRVLAVKDVAGDPNLEGKGNRTIKYEGNTGVPSPQNPSISLPYLSIKVYDPVSGRSNKKHYGVITTWSGNGQAPPSPPRVTEEEMMAEAATWDFGRRKAGKLNIKRLTADLKRLAKC